MKKALLLLIFVSILPMAFGYDICGDGAEIQTKCAMITPEITQCDNYSYEIKNVSNVLVESGQLSKYTDNSYYFNFTQPEGRYAIRLCDGGIREVFVVNPPEIKFYLYLLALTIFFSLLAIGYVRDDTMFYVIAGFLAVAIAVNLWNYGFPNLENDFLQTVMVVIFAGIGFFFIVAPFVNEFENWNLGKRGGDKW